MFISDNTQESPNPILLNTPGRSGGTLLMQTLSAHPQIITCSGYPFEQRPACYGLITYQLLSGETPKDIELYKEIFPHFSRFLCGLYKGGKIPISDPYELNTYNEEFINELGGFYNKSVRRFYRSIASQVNKPDPLYFVEKVPFCLNSTFLNVFKTSPIIFLIRDPRDAVISADKYFGKINKNSKLTQIDRLKEIGQGIYGNAWKAMACEIKRCQKSSLPHLVVKYENLIIKPEETIHGIASFLSLSEHGIETCVEATKRSANEKHATSQSPATSISRWKRELERDEQEVVQKMFGEVAVELGYTDNN